MCFRSIFRHEKKVLALVLAFACAFTMFAGAAFTDQADINTDNVEAVDLLTTLGIIKGYEDGSFDPEGTVDRAEMAKMIYTIRNGGNDDASAHVGNTTSFTDISGHWAEGYIKYLQNTGIVAGKSATQFAPDAQVTTAEAMKMALALAGYDEVNAGLTGIDWQKNTLTYATTIGLTDNVASAMNAGCTRQDAAQILANALGATAVRYSAVVENFVNDSEDGLSFGGPAISVGRKWMDLWTSIGTLYKIDGQDLSIYPSQSDEADSDKDDGVVIKDFIRVGTDYSDLMGQKVKVLFEDGKNNSVIGVYAVPDNEVIVVNQNAVTADGARVRINDVSYALSTDLMVVKDGDVQNQAFTSSDFEDKASADVLSFIDSDDDGKIDFIYEKTVTVAKVSYTSSSQIVAGGETYRYADDNIAEDVAKDNWVMITKNLYNDNNDIVVAATETGNVSAYRDNTTPKQYRIGDEWYNASNSSTADISNGVREGVDVEYVAVNGILFYAKRTTGSDHLQDVLFVMSKTTSGTRAEVMYPNGATEEIRVSDNSVANWDAGYFYEYSRSGNYYRLSAIDLAENAYGDYSAVVDNNNTPTNSTDDTMATTGAIDVTSGSITGYKYGDVSGAADVYAIDDSADVIVYANNANVQRAKHITGKQLKALAASGVSLDTTDGYGAFYSDVKGEDKATVVAVKANHTSLADFNDDFGTLTTFANYGFITGVVGKTSGGNVEFYMWDGAENRHVISDSNDDTGLVAGAIVGYDDMTANDDGSYDLVNATAVAADPAYIGWASGDEFRAYDEGTATAVGDDGNFDNILYVDTSEASKVDENGTDCYRGVADGSPVEAEDNVTNALYVGTDLIVIDVSGALNGNNVGTYSVTLDNVSSSGSNRLFRSFQMVNRYTGETYNDDFKAYDSVYEIRFEAIGDGTLYIDTTPADGDTTGVSKILDFEAGDDTDENSGLIELVEINSDIRIWAETATATPTTDIEVVGNGLRDTTGLVFGNTKTIKADFTVTNGGGVTPNIIIKDNTDSDATGFTVSVDRITTDDKTYPSADITMAGCDAGEYTVSVKVGDAPEVEIGKFTVAKAKISTLTPTSVTAPTSSALTSSPTAPSITFSDATYGFLVTATANPTDWVETNVGGGSEGTWEANDVATATYTLAITDSNYEFDSTVTVATTNMNSPTSATVSGNTMTIVYTLAY